MSVQHAPRSQATAPTAAPELALTEIRAELEEQRQFRAEQIERLGTDADEAIRSGDDVRLEVTRSLTAAAQTALAEINAALRRLDAGEYGVCEDCGGSIPLERLEVLPTSRLCMPCQARSESAGSGRGGRRRAGR